MERLTYRTDIGFPLVKESIGEPRYHKAEERLAEYEDIGYAPYQIQEIITAAVSICRDSEPFDGDKVLCNVATLNHLFAVVAAGKENET